MTKLEEILEAYQDEQFITADGFDEAIIGVEENSMRLIYSSNKCIEILHKGTGGDYIDALEFFQFNVKGSNIGENMPIWCEEF